MPKRKPPFQGEATLTERRQQAAFDTLMRAEENLKRALNRWQKARKTFHAYLRRTDKKRAAEADWTDIAKSADQVKDPDDATQLNTL